MSLNVDPVILGLSRLAYQFKDSEKFKAFITAFLKEFQELYNSGNQLLTERYLDTAVGIQLDEIGEIVGKERNPKTLDDESYRAYIRIQVFGNHISMTVEETLQLISCIFDCKARYFSLELLPRYDLDKELSSFEKSLLPTLPVLIGLNRAVYHAIDQENNFSFGDDPDGLGFGDFNNPSVGGNFAQILIA